MRLITLAALAAGILCTGLVMASPLRIPGPHSERVHHTQIKASLDVEKHRVDAQMTLRWTNTSDTELTEIPFHLYLNAFSSTDSVFMVESEGGRLRSDYREGDDQENFGYVLVSEITSANNESLMSHWQVDGDTAILDLPTPLQAGQEIELNMVFQSQLPKVFARSGHDGDTFNIVAQWFPKPGVYIDGRWVNHNYHADSEFFADFGSYDVELTVPSDFVVGATGFLANKSDSGESTTHHYIAEDVHDFVWVADSQFSEAETNWQGLNIRLLYREPLDEKSIQNQFDASIASFEWLEKNVGVYPYSTMTLVQPPKNASGARGMEYPTLVTTITNIDHKEYIQLAALVTIHEIGHNYWQGIFASNEFEESWMDEGINSYTEGRIMSEALGREKAFKLDHLAVEIPFGHRFFSAISPTIDAVNTKSWEYGSRGSYRNNSYAKPATILNTVDRIWGTEKVDQLLKNYYQQWAFKHPTTEDFLNIANSVDPEMAAFLDEAINTKKTIDLTVSSVKSRKKQSVGGFSFTSPDQEPEFVAPEESDGFKHSVTLVRTGELYPPSIDVLLTYSDGSTETRQWQFDNKVAWEKWQWESDVQLEEVLIDPSFKLMLDKNLANNIKREKSKGHESWRWVFAIAQSLQNSFSLLLPL